ncbi:MAG TPA: ferritin-like domain-containing protein, partial [Polyangiaceae bacterium]|nr:ferritin-like domain-containing protein [Polyangiaceae bacterium]
VGTREGAGKIRIQYAKEGLPVGSIPKPAEVKEKLKALIGAGVSPVLLDKLGERMAFERTGTRLYEALLSKYEAYGSFDGGPEREDLLEILNEEHRHFSELGLQVRMLGGDPTAVTPSANLAAVASEGVLKVVTDPRTTLLQSLEGVLIAELVDNDCWHVLSQLAKRHGLEDLITLCQEAEATEQRHLDRVRAWLAAGNASG